MRMRGGREYVAGERERTRVHAGEYGTGGMIGTNVDDGIRRWDGASSWSMIVCCVREEGARGV